VDRRAAPQVSGAPERRAETANELLVAAEHAASRIDAGIALLSNTTC